MNRGKAEMKKTDTIDLKLVNDDAERRTLDAYYRDALVVEDQFKGPIRLTYGGRPVKVTVTTDADGYGAVDWLTEGLTPNDLGDSGGERDKPPESEVKVRLMPPKRPEKGRA